MEHTKGELKIVTTFDKLYLHIGPVRIADIPNTGALTEEERIANARRLVLCWNCHDDLLTACESAYSINADNFASVMAILKAVIFQVDRKYFSASSKAEITD